MIREQLVKALTLGHRGYNLKSVYIECYGDVGRRDASSCGFQLRTDYTDYYKAINSLPPPPTMRPYLFGISRDEAKNDPMCLVASVFLNTPPSLRLTAKEQEVLRLAAAGYNTNEQIAENQGVTTFAVNAHFDKIFEKIREKNPSIFNVGGSKRNAIITYIRTHREELIPSKHIFCED